jgi:hypothetical protein
MVLLSHIFANVDRSYPSRFHPRGRRQRITKLSRENAGRQLSTSLIAAGENLAEHPHRRLIEGAISFWRAGAAQFRQGLLAVTLLLVSAVPYLVRFWVRLQPTPTLPTPRSAGCAQHAFTRKTTSSSMRSQSGC